MNEITLVSLVYLYRKNHSTLCCVKWTVSSWHEIQIILKHFQTVTTNNSAWLKG